MTHRFGEYKSLFRAVFLLILSIVSIQILSRWQVFTQEIYPQFYKKIYPFWSGLFGEIPFSVGDILYLIVGITLLTLVVLGVKCTMCHQRWRLHSIGTKIIYLFLFFYLFFHIIWAFNYHRSPIFPKSEKIASPELLKTMANEFLSQSIRYRSQLPENEKGVMIYDKKNFRKEIHRNLSDSLNIFPYHYIPKRAIKKYSLYSPAFHYLGISGYYNPFSGEAQVLRGTLGSRLPFSMAHEQAHQMGYAREYEASFVGYVTCVQSDSDALKYSAHYTALKYTLRALYPMDSAFVHRKLDEFSPGMQRDRAEEIYENQKYSGMLDEGFSAMNNLYLKSNQQQEGVSGYSRFLDMLVAYWVASH